MATKLTERAVLDLLRQRHTASGNGGAGEHAFLPHVRNAAGFDATRTFDAVAVNLWPSRGLVIHVYEVKVSRSDWRRELAKPDKAEDACRVADRFSIVAPAGAVHDGELPPTWGLIEVRGDGTDAKPWKLREKSGAPLLHDQPTRTKDVPRGLLVGLLRSAPGAVPGGKNPSPAEKELRATWSEGFDAGRKAGLSEAERSRGAQQHVLDDVRAMEKALQEAGLDRYQSGPNHLRAHAATVAAALRGGDVAGQVERTKTALRRALEALDGAA